MRSFMDRDFLLKTDTARLLYHQYAAPMPIVDYHCHINPREIYEDRHYDSIAGLWLEGDHYKWRAMRYCGVPEEYITGSASDEEKFRRWAACMPMLIGNPLYHWTHLELQRYFGITEPLNEKNAGDIYARCNSLLAGDGFSVRDIIRKSGVKLICTTDDPIDDLCWHTKLAADPTLETKVLPAFRPDKAMRADKPSFPAYVEALEKTVGFPIRTVEEMRRALRSRIAFFADHGCLVSDHGLDTCLCEVADEAALDGIFARARAGKPITDKEQNAYHTALLLSVAAEYAQRGWVMQLHFSCIRNPSLKMFDKIGPDTGYDCMGTASNAEALARLLGLMEASDALPKTILYSLNPSDNTALGTIAGSFNTNGGVPGKVTQGAAWWFNDHRDGMEAQMRSLMSVGAFGTFNGMLTDSRSFLSYTRHEYFRRILCNLLGEIVENGEYPADMDSLGETVQNISYRNAVRYFGFDKLLSL